MGTKIDATAIAQPYRDDVKAKIAELKKNGIGRLLNT
jgi:magnesium-transporting ATPase (P-type)